MHYPKCYTPPVFQQPWWQFCIMVWQQTSWCHIFACGANKHPSTASLLYSLVLVLSTLQALQFSSYFVHVFYSVFMPPLHSGQSHDVLVPSVSPFVTKWFLRNLSLHKPTILMKLMQSEGALNRFLFKAITRGHSCCLDITRQLPGMYVNFNFVIYFIFWKF